MKTPLQPLKDTQSLAHREQQSNQHFVTASRNASANSLRSQSNGSIDDLVILAMILLETFFCIRPHPHMYLQSDENLAFVSHLVCFENILIPFYILQAYVSDFDNVDDRSETGKDLEMASEFHPVPPMRPPQPMTFPLSTNVSSRQTVAVHAPTNASLARGRLR